MKKLVSVLLAAAVALSSALIMTGCEEQEYPVSIANYTIEKEPENVVVLDPVTADIMAYMDFERKFAGRSKEVTQPELKAAPVVGTEENPDIDQIVKLKTDLVFCNDKIAEDAQKKLESKGIQVIKLQSPKRPLRSKRIMKPSARRSPVPKRAALPARKPITSLCRTWISKSARLKT